MMKKIFSAFLPLTCLGVFLVSPVLAAEPVNAAVQAAAPVQAAKPVYAAEKKSPTLSALRKEVDKLQKEMGVLAQGQSAIGDRIRVLEQQAKQSVKINMPNLYTYP